MFEGGEGLEKSQKWGRSETLYPSSTQKEMGGKGARMSTKKRRGGGAKNSCLYSTTSKEEQGQSGAKKQKGPKCDHPVKRGKDPEGSRGLP